MFVRTSVLSAGRAGALTTVHAIVLAASTACQSAAPARPAPSANAWAVVDGREITAEDVDKAYRRTMNSNLTPSPEELMTAKLELLNEMVVQDLLMAKAKALKVEVTDAELDSAFSAERKDIPEDAFQAELKTRQLTATDMRDGLRQQLLARKVIEREVTAKVSVSDQEISGFYEANKAQFNFPEDAIHLAQIVVTAGPDQQVANRSGDDATTPELAQRKMQMLMERLKGGAPFADLARDFSEDPESAPRGGDLGFVPISRIRQAPPQLRDAVLKSEPGTVTTVNAGGVFQIVLVVAREAAGQRDLSTPGVRDGIVTTLRGRREQLLRTAYLNTLRNAAAVVNIAAKKVYEAPGTIPAFGLKAPGTP